MKRPILIAVLVAGLAFLAWFSIRLAGIRLYQVDECQNVYVAHLLATGQAGSAFTSISLFLFPLIWLGHAATNSVDLFVSARFFSLELFWLNIVLIALATGERLFSLRGLAALAGAATLAPMWDYGFEIRHDNMLLAGVLLTWCAVRVRPAGIQSYLIAGALAVGLEFVAFKAFVYVVPISCAILAFPPPGHKSPRWKLGLAWTAGALGAFLAVRIAYGAAGLWDIYLGDVHEISADANGGNRFAPWQTLARLLAQTPLLVALVSAALAAAATELGRHRRKALTWEGNLPEVTLFLVAGAALIINPAPYPYNLLHLVPYAYLVAFRYGVGLVPQWRSLPGLAVLGGAIVVFTHLAPFGIATRRHLDWTNYNQERLMHLAENLTDPARDCVYDGIGMVPMRRSIHYQWFLHSLNLHSFILGRGPRVRDMLAANPAAVFIPSYRTDWLPREDHAYISRHYVPMADDFWVLGTEVPAGGGSFEIIHAGRYRISSVQDSDILGSYPEDLGGLGGTATNDTFTCILDGAPFSGGVAELSAGAHQIKTSPDCQPAAVWVGPQLNRIGRPPQSDHRLLFVNWY